MKIGLFGNCQAGAIAQLFAEHLSEDEIISYKAIHTMDKNDKIKFLEDIKNVDILIHQPISNVYRPVSTENIMSIIGKESSVIFPVIYFSPYFMDMTYLKNESGLTDRQFIGDYHSRIVLSAYYHELDRSKIVKAFNSKNFFSKKQIQDNLEESIRVLKEREKECDIKISDIIESNYQKSNLFFTFNHPTGNMLYPVVERILSHINRPSLSKAIKLKYSRVLGGIHWRSVESIHEGLHLDFRKTDNFFVNNKIYTLNEFIDISWDFYKKNNKLVRSNLDRIFPVSSFENAGTL